MNVVRNIRTLKAMEKKGFIKLLPETGTKIKTLSGSIITCCYVHDYADGEFGEFVYNKQKYRLKYFDGCFYPFVVAIV